LIERDELLDLACNLIQIPSSRDVPGQEREIGLFLAAWLRDAGLEVELQEVENERYNVLARLRGEKDGPSLMLNGHLDTVPAPATMKIAPYEPKVMGGRLYGLGAADMKGGLAAMAYAMITLKRASTSLCGDLIFAGVVGEESGSLGTEHLVKHGLQAEMAIVGEPTDLAIVTAHKGVERLRIVVKGKAAHASHPEKGVNAIVKAAKLVTAIEERLIPRLKERQDELLGSPTLNIGTIRGGGERPNIVPPSCEIKLDRRWLPGETIPGIFAELQEIIDELRREDPELEAELERDESQGIVRLPHEPLKCPRDHSLVQALEESLQQVGLQPVITGASFWTDAALLSTLGKIPAVVFGPGDIAQAHSDSEFIEIEEMIAATRIYALTALKICKSRNKTLMNALKEE
jgi:acetylornithine deacetylase/succinyl-diaminopimelate desuccinylase